MRKPYQRKSKKTSELLEVFPRSAVKFFSSLTAWNCLRTTYDFHNILQRRKTVSDSLQFYFAINTYSKEIKSKEGEHLQHFLKANPVHQSGFHWANYIFILTNTKNNHSLHWAQILYLPKLSSFLKFFPFLWYLSAQTRHHIFAILSLKVPATHQ